MGGRAWRWLGAPAAGLGAPLVALGQPAAPGTQAAGVADEAVPAVLPGFSRLLQAG